MSRTPIGAPARASRITGGKATGTKPSLFKIVFQRLGLILFGACLALAAVECAMRLAGAARRRSFERASVSTSVAGAIRILCLGESTTAPTWPWDHSWPRQLQAILDKRAPGRFQIVNRGAVGTTSDVLERELPSFIESIQPQLIVAMIGINDNQWYGIAQPDRRALEERLRFLRELRIYRLWRYIYHDRILHTAPVTPGQTSLPYRDRVVEMIRGRRIPLALMQYPGIDVSVLKDHFAGLSEISFIDNLSSFEEALARGKFADYFDDRFAGHWGHCSALGDRLIAENAAEGIARALKLRLPAAARDRTAAAASERPRPPWGSGWIEGYREIPGTSRNTPIADRAISAAPNLPAQARARAYVARARSLIARKDEHGAEDCLLKALSLAPDDMTALRIMLELKQSDPKEALPYADQAVAESRRKAVWDQRWAHLERARLRWKLDDRAAAREDARLALEIEPDNLESLRMMVEFTRERRAEAALYADRAERVIQNFPGWDRARSYLESARIRLLLDDRAAARALARKALALDGGDLDALRMLIALSPDKTSAAAWADRLADAAPQSPGGERAAACLESARLRLTLGDHQAAEARVEQALQIEPSSLEALRMMLDLKRGDLPAAVSLSDRIVEAEKNLPAGQRVRSCLDSARLYLLAADRTRARARTEQALDLDPVNLDALRMMLDLTRADAAQAAPWADRLVRAALRSPAQARCAAYLEQARIRRALNDSPGAKKSIQAALRIAPSDIDALNAMTDLERENPREALSYFGPTPSRRGDKARWLALRGLTRMFAQDHAGARMDLGAAGSILPATACADSSAPFDRSRFEPYYFDLCLRHYPRSAALYSDRGVALYQRGKTKEAASDFNRAIELEPDLTQAYLSLAAVLTNMGQNAAALEIAQKGLASCHGESGKQVCRDALALTTTLSRGSGRASKPSAP